MKFTHNNTAFNRHDLYNAVSSLSIEEGKIRDALDGLSKFMAQLGPEVAKYIASDPNKMLTLSGLIKVIQKNRGVTRKISPWVRASQAKVVDTVRGHFDGHDGLQRRLDEFKAIRRELLNNSLDSLFARSRKGERRGDDYKVSYVNAEEGYSFNAVKGTTLFNRGGRSQSAYRVNAKLPGNWATSAAPALMKASNYKMFVIEAAEIYGAHKYKCRLFRVQARKLTKSTFVWGPQESGYLTFANDEAPLTPFDLSKCRVTRCVKRKELRGFQRYTLGYGKTIEGAFKGMESAMAKKIAARMLTA